MASSMYQHNLDRINYAKNLYIPELKKKIEPLEKIASRLTRLIDRSRDQNERMQATYMLSLVMEGNPGKTVNLRGGFMANDLSRQFEQSMSGWDGKGLNELRRELQRQEADIAEWQEIIPTSEQREAGQRELDSACSDLSAETARLEDRWTVLADLLHEAVPIAEEIVKSEATCKEYRAVMGRLQSEYGIVPTSPAYVFNVSDSERGNLIAGLSIILEMVRHRSIDNDTRKRYTPLSNNGTNGADSLPSLDLDPLKLGKGMQKALRSVEESERFNAECDKNGVERVPPPGPKGKRMEVMT